MTDRVPKNVAAEATRAACTLLGTNDPQCGDVIWHCLVGGVDVSLLFPDESRT